MIRTSIAIAMVGLAACATTPSDGDAAIDGDAPQQLSQGGGKGDGAALSKDPRLVNCHLEYEAFMPIFASRTAGDVENTFGEVENNGIVAGDTNFMVRISTNPKPPANLSFIAQISSTTNRDFPLSYIVLPRPHVGGAFLFELGTPIPTVTFPDTGESFNFLRAYCSIRMP